jgi:FtsZ-binding cell division protein ZapB
MDTETRERFDRLEDKLDQAIETRALLDAHVERKGATEIHHTPSCDVMLTHLEDHKKDKRADKTNLIAVSALALTAVGLLFKLVLGN